MKSIAIASQTFTKRASRVKLPYIDQVSGFYLFGTNEASSTTNLAYGASTNLTKVATPTYGTGYAVIDGTNGFDTGLLLDTPFTQLAVVYTPAAASAIAVYGRGAASGESFNQMLTWDTSNGTVAGYPNGASSQSIASLGASGFMLIGQTWGGTGTRNIVYAMVGDTLSNSASSNSVTKTVTPTHNLKIGTGYNVGTATTRIAAGVLAASVLNIEQIYRMGVYLRALLATRSVTML